MRCVKTEEFVRRISEDAAALLNELEGFLGSGGGANARAVCDRVLHACYQRLGSQLEAGLVHTVVRLVQLAVGGYEQVEGLRPSAPLYLEKMLFHILQKLMKVGKQHCADLAQLLFQRLKVNTPQEEEKEKEEYLTLVQNCFALLWNAAGGVRESHVPGPPPTPGPTHTPGPPHTPGPLHTLRVRLEALRFRLLQESVCVRGGPSKGCVYVEEALLQYRRACGTLTHTHAAAMMQLLQECVVGPLWSAGECVCDHDLLCVLTIKVCKMLCGAELWDLANQQVADAEGRVQRQGEEHHPALQLCDWSVRLHRLLRTSESDEGHAYASCAQLLSNRAITVETHSQPILEACQLVVWATETGPRNGMEAGTLVACMSFLEQHQQTIRALQTGREVTNLQTTLCQSLCQTFSSTHTSLKKSKVLEGVCLQQVVERLQGSVTELLQELQKLANENLLQHAVSTMNGVVFELFNRKLHQEALSLVKPLCAQLVKSRPPSMSTERVTHCFLQAVQSFRHSFRRVGDQQGALQAVSDWLLCLREEELRDVCSRPHTHSHTHPIRLWARIKADAAKSGQEELLLRTLRDSFQGAEPGDAVMMQLLEAELCAYAAGSHDLHRETYNTLCDLLDLCPEDNFAQESLRLLEAEPETVANADWLRDDQAHASLWLYICQLESSLQEKRKT
ncbi:separin-like [Sardina pilchardus]|uniref:separin-like n=1 Tax=Sardina pilchardus TaxID=27697 RepID=UPI002E12D826